MIHGIDVSSVQGIIDWPTVAAVGIRFAWMKCGEGNGGLDPTYARNVHGCRENAIAPGAYWYAYALPPKSDGDGRSPREEAQRFFLHSGGLGRGRGELPPALDLEHPEVGDWGRWGCDAKQLGTWHRDFAAEVTQLWGRLPILYTYPFWAKAVHAGGTFGWAADYPLWIANYMHIEKDAPPIDAKPIVPPPWKDWLAWQWSANKGRHVPGILTDIDRNVVRSLDDLVLPPQELPTQPTIHAFPERVTLPYEFDGED